MIKHMSEKQELFVKKGVFLMDKYFFPKRIISCVVKGFVGMILFWIYEFFSTFGGFSNYQKFLADSLKQLNSSVQLRSQLEDFRSSPMFIAVFLGLIIFSFIIGYIFLSFTQLIVDLLRRKVFKDFDINKTL